MIEVKNLILGGGISGLAAGLHLREISKDYLILEKDVKYGGLCQSFRIGDFIFDNFIHLSFTTNEFVRKKFDIIPHYSHIPNPYNYYHGKWIKHPAMNNLFPLSQKEKDLVLQGLSERDRYADRWNKNYEYWLRYQFGDYFAEHFPLVYTRKYWVREAENMETKWIGNRVYQPSIDEILLGMKSENTPVTYYAKEMRYPQNCGYEGYLKTFAGENYIKLNERVVNINIKSKVVETSKDVYHYDNLYSSIPLPDLTSIIKDDGCEEYEEFCKGLRNLHWTSGYLISLGIRGEIPRKDLWDYVYDEDIFISRYYSPSLMSENMAPHGCYSIQAEVYTKDGAEHSLDSSDLLKLVIDQMDEIGALDSAEIIVKDIRFRKYCNILFDHEIYRNRRIALNYLRNHGIKTIGRFGEWEYFWSDQSFMSGYKAVGNKEV